jgi:hypothetical protein
MVDGRIVYGWWRIGSDVAMLEDGSTIRFQVDEGERSDHPQP